MTLALILARGVSLCELPWYKEMSVLCSDTQTTVRTEKHLHSFPNSLHCLELETTLTRSTKRLANLIPLKYIVLFILGKNII